MYQNNLKIMWPYHYKKTLSELITQLLNRQYFSIAYEHIITNYMLVSNVIALLVNISVFKKSMNEWL